MQIDEIKVRKIMREKGFSQKELADELKIHPSTKNIAALAELFSTTPEEITKETSNPSFGNFQPSFHPSFDFSHATININLPNKSSINPR
jgi:transcriptional regulator with XRE-family HTH domain